MRDKKEEQMKKEHKKQPKSNAYLNADISIVIPPKHCVIEESRSIARSYSNDSGTDRHIAQWHALVILRKKSEHAKCY
jgi:hypothetical protein